jgi:hypothetical protein
MKRARCGPYRSSYLSAVLKHMLVLAWKYELYSSSDGGASEG